ncbi:hypothetical protein D082_04300 [Synechocystis sp. PCC 6714]|nr:hypothetical protein D082_04300 [Synechocystis sp. PCC 6714]
MAPFSKKNLKMIGIFDVLGIPIPGDRHWGSFLGFYRQ